MNRPVRHAAALMVVLAAALLPSAGCKSAAATAMLLIKGNNVDPDFAGLKGKKVAVVCRPLVSLQYRNATATRDIAQQMTLLLQHQVPKIEMIDQRKVAKWTDENTWDEFPQVGKALKADMVVGVDLEGFDIYEGQTLYKGRANARVRVYDCSQGGKMVFDKVLPQTVYPPNSVVPASERTEAEFHNEFVAVLADQIARHFYAHDPYADVAQDAKTLR